MQAALPKTFLNLVSVLDVVLVKNLNHNEFCIELHKFECKCAAFPSSEQAELISNFRFNFKFCRFNFKFYLIFLIALSAISLWNNMFEPVGKKQKSVNFDKKIICPTKEQPYLYTRKNSDRTKRGELR